MEEVRFQFNEAPRSAVDSAIVIESGRVLIDKRALCALSERPDGGEERRPSDATHYHARFV